MLVKWRKIILKRPIWEGGVVEQRIGPLQSNQRDVLAAPSMLRVDEALKHRALAQNTLSE